MKIEYSPDAISDLFHIEEFYAGRAGSNVAAAMRSRLRSTLELVVAKNPRVGRSRADLGARIRSFPILPFIVFYRLKGYRIFVQRILHGHRDIRPPLASLLAAV